MPKDGSICIFFTTFASIKRVIREAANENDTYEKTTSTDAAAGAPDGDGEAPGEGT